MKLKVRGIPTNEVAAIREGGPDADVQAAQIRVAEGPAIVRGYGEDHWIRYDTGDVVPGRELDRVCRSILEDPTIAYVHVRSKYNCFQARVDRG